MSHAEPKELATLGWTLHAAGFCLLLAIAGGYWTIVRRPAVVASRQIEQRIATVSRLLENRGALRREYEQLTEVLDGERQRAAAVRQQIPDDSNEAEFLRQLSNAAARGGVVIDDYTRGTVSKESEFSQLDIHVECTGTFESICRFLEGLESLPRVSEVIALNLTSKGQGDKYPLRVTIRLYFGVHPAPGPAGSASYRADPVGPFPLLARLCRNTSNATSWQRGIETARGVTWKS